MRMQAADFPPPRSSLGESNACHRSSFIGGGLVGGIDLRCSLDAVTPGALAAPVDVTSAHCRIASPATSSPPQGWSWLRLALTRQELADPRPKSSITARAFCWPHNRAFPARG